jgi:hypothetical protein
LLRWKKKINGNHQVTLGEVAEEVEISIHSCHTILTEDLGMHWVLAKSRTRLFDCSSPPKSKWWKSFEKCHYWWEEVSLWLWHWSRTTILTLEESYFDFSQESMTGVLASESNGACFFFLDHWGTVH